MKTARIFSMKRKDVMLLKAGEYGTGKELYKVHYWPESDQSISDLVDEKEFEFLHFQSVFPCFVRSVLSNGTS